MKLKRHPETWNSYQWARKLKVFNIGEMKSEKDLKIDELLILDPDGWDRGNLDKSYAENITEAEFYNRVMQCTVISGKEWGVKKKRYIKYSPDTGDYCIDTERGFLAYLDTLDPNQPEKFIIEIVEMTETEFNNLPEFTGF